MSSFLKSKIQRLKNKSKNHKSFEDDKNLKKDKHFLNENGKKLDDEYQENQYNKHFDSEKELVTTNEENQENRPQEILKLDSNTKSIIYNFLFIYFKDFLDNQRDHFFNTHKELNNAISEKRKEINITNSSERKSVLKEEMSNIKEKIYNNDNDIIRFTVVQKYFDENFLDVLEGIFKELIKKDEISFFVKNIQNFNSINEENKNTYQDLKKQLINFTNILEDVFLEYFSNSDEINRKINSELQKSNFKDAFSNSIIIGDEPDDDGYEIKVSFDENECQFLIQQYYTLLTDEERKMYPPNCIDGIYLISEYDQINRFFEKNKIIKPFFTLKHISFIKKELMKRDAILFGYRDVFDIEEDKIFKLPDEMKTANNKLKCFLILNNIDERLLQFDEVDENTGDLENPYENDETFEDDEEIAVLSNSKLNKSYDSSLESNIEENMNDYVEDNNSKEGFFDNVPLNLELSNDEIRLLSKITNQLTLGYQNVLKEQNLKENVQYDPYDKLWGEYRNNESDHLNNYVENEKQHQGDENKLEIIDLGKVITKAEKDLRDEKDKKYKQNENNEMNSLEIENERILKQKGFVDFTVEKEKQLNSLDSLNLEQNKTNKITKLSEENKDNTKESQEELDIRFDKEFDHFYQETQLNKIKPSTNDTLNVQDGENNKTSQKIDKNNENTKSNKIVGGTENTEESDNLNDSENNGSGNNNNTTNSTDSGGSSSIETLQEKEIIYLDSITICHMTPRMYYVQLCNGVRSVIGVNTIDIKKHKGREYIEVKDDYYSKYKVLKRGEKKNFSAYSEKMSAEEMRNAFVIKKISVDELEEDSRDISFDK